jgi:RNA polymerase sigma factor (sigma-70 family)
MTRYVGFVEQPLHAVTSRPDRSSVPVQPAVPEVLARLLEAADERARDEAWTQFVDEHSRLLLYVARRNTPDYDGAMDAYAFVLEKLREQESHRLRGYAADGRGKFTTWLVVVSRRLCLDFHRHRYGRSTNSGPTVDVDDTRAARRRLFDLASSTGDDSLASQVSDDDPAGTLRREELERALDAVMKELTAPDRLLLALRFHDGLSAAEIASMLHFASPFHVYRRINQLLASLRERLAKRGVQSSVP